MRANIPRHNRASSNEATFAKSDTANYRGVRTYGDTFFDPRFHGYPVHIAAPRSKIIG